jgi:hypothetical protein
MLRNIYEAKFRYSSTAKFCSHFQLGHEAFKSHLTDSGTLYTSVQNEHTFTRPSETIDNHEEWFKDPTGFGKERM